MANNTTQNRPPQTTPPPPDPPQQDKPPQATPPPDAVQGRPPVVLTMDDVSLALHEQAKLGIREVNDFEEAAFELRESIKPPVFPDVVRDKPVRYLLVDAENPFNNPYVAKQLAVPVTRDTVPGIPESCFGGSGLVREGDSIWFVMSRSAYEKQKQVNRKRICEQVEALNRDEETERRVKAQGGLATGVELAEHAPA